MLLERRLDAYARNTAYNLITGVGTLQYNVVVDLTCLSVPIACNMLHTTAQETAFNQTKDTILSCLYDCVNFLHIRQAPPGRRCKVFSSVMPKTATSDNNKGIGSDACAYELHEKPGELLQESRNFDHQSAGYYPRAAGIPERWSVTTPNMFPTSEISLKL